MLYSALKESTGHFVVGGKLSALDSSIVFNFVQQTRYQELSLHGLTNFRVKALFLLEIHESFEKIQTS